MLWSHLISLVVKPSASSATNYLWEAFMVELQQTTIWICEAAQRMQILITSETQRIHVLIKKSIKIVVGI